jgi:beta-glucosidase
MFPFGHGLTPGVVEYRNLRVSLSAVATDGSVEVEVTVANIGSEDAVEVVQLYQSDTLAQVVRPNIQLVGYARVALPAGSSRVVTFSVHTDLLSFTGRAGERIVEPGEVVFSSGPSAGQRTVFAAIELVGAIRSAGHDRVLRAYWSAVAPD